MSENTSLVSQQEFKKFIQAIKAGSLEQTEAILRNSHQSIVNRIDSQSNQPPLYVVAVLKDDEVSLQLFKLLIRHGANYKFKDSIEQTVLFYVCRQGKQKCLQMLLSHGLNLDEVDKYGQTPLFYATNENKIEIVRKYATKQRVNHVDNLAGQTPIYYAARRGHLELCRLLIEKGADVSHTDSTGKTALEYARKAKYAEVAELLLNQLKRNKQTNKFSMQSYSFEESNLEKRKKKEETQKVSRQTYKIVYLNEKGEPHDLTEDEVRQLIRDRPELQAYLVNPQSIPGELLQSSASSNWQKIASKILLQCSKLKGSFWFAEPVDPIKFGIIDYFDVIKKPMDLGTVRRKISHNCYVSADEFVSDMKLIWENCLRYNGQSHDISKCARQLQVGFNEYVVSNGFDKFIQNK